MNDDDIQWPDGRWSYALNKFSEDGTAFRSSISNRRFGDKEATVIIKADGRLQMPKSLYSRSAAVTLLPMIHFLRRNFATSIVRQPVGRAAYRDGQGRLELDGCHS
jgi:hypothetical protein